jgi:hypothetical protein
MESHASDADCLARSLTEPRARTGSNDWIVYEDDLTDPVDESTAASSRRVHAQAQHWQTTRTSQEYECTVTSRPAELWTDPTSYRWRVLATDFPSQDGDYGRGTACAEGMTRELGGDASRSFMFVPPDTLEPFGPAQTASWDIVDHLRGALADGRAHMDGRTEIAGRTVERIRIEPTSGAQHPEAAER